MYRFRYGVIPTDWLRLCLVIISMRVSNICYNTILIFCFRFSYVSGSYRFSDHYIKPMYTNVYSQTEQYKISTNCIRAANNNKMEQCEQLIILRTIQLTF